MISCKQAAILWQNLTIKEIRLYIHTSREGGCLLMVLGSESVRSVCGRTASLAIKVKGYAKSSFRISTVAVSKLISTSFQTDLKWKLNGPESNLHLSDDPSPYYGKHFQACKALWTLTEQLAREDAFYTNCLWGFSSRVQIPDLGQWYPSHTIYYSYIETRQTQEWRISCSDYFGVLSD